MIEIVDKQKLPNGFTVIKYKTPFHNWWIAVFNNNNSISEEARGLLEKMSWKIQRIKDENREFSYDAYIIRCYSKRAFSMLLEKVNSF